MCLFGALGIQDGDLSHGKSIGAGERVTYCTLEAICRLVFRRGLSLRRIGTTA